MLRGCMVALVVLVGSYYIEKQFVIRVGLSDPEVVSGLLALCLALMAGAIDGTFFVHGRELGEDGTSKDYQDGKVVRISGQLRLLTPAVVSPLTNRGVAIYSYLLRSANGDGSDDLHSSKMLSGVAMAACEVVTRNGSVRLEGFPDLKHFKEETIDAGPSVAAIAKRLTTRQWTLRTGNKVEDYSFAEVQFGLDGGVEDFLNHSAQADLLPGDSEMDVFQRLARYRWRATETVIVPGATVTVMGTYHANPARLKIDKALFNFDHELRPGDGAEVVKREVHSQWVGTIVFLLVGIGLHVLVFAAEGKFYKALLALLDSLELE